MIALPGDAVRRIRRWASPPDGLWTVILAAGGARRFGRHKLLRRIGAESLLARSVQRAAMVTPGRTVVVLGCRASLLRRDLARRPVRIVVNRRWREGMASSLAAGLGALPPSATAALILLADQYALEPPDLHRLARAWSREPGRPAAAESAGLPSAPAILPRSWFPRVMDLRGDQGARRLLRDDAVAPTLVPMPAARLDLDARHELAAFRRIALRNPWERNRRLAKAPPERYIR